MLWSQDQGHRQGGTKMCSLHMKKSDIIGMEGKQLKVISNLKTAKVAENAESYECRRQNAVDCTNPIPHSANPITQYKMQK